ncbi:glutaredoxin family protein [Pseudomonas aeruginosa]
MCVEAERSLLPLLDRKQVDIEVVHLAEQSARIAEAEKAGVKSVPALVVDGQVLHLNFGAALSDLK